MQHTPNSKRRYWFGLPILLVLLGSCTGSQFCTQIGAESGVIFELDVVQGLAESKLPVWVHACVERTCVTRTTAPSEGRTFVRVLAPWLSHEGPVRVEAQITDWSGQRVFDATKTVRVHKHQPNGPDCDPTTYEAGVIATADGELTDGLAPVDDPRSLGLGAFG